MTWEFAGSPKHTLGVELELGIVDEATGELAGAAPELLAWVYAAGSGLDPAHVKRELFESTLEITTGVCRTAGAVHDDLAAQLAVLAPVLRSGRLRLIGAGAHPFSRWQQQAVTPEGRYLQIVDTYGWPVRQLTTYGLHFHVGVPTGDHAIAAMNALAGLLPHFLALSASSPFWQAADSGFASARSSLWEAVPSAGLPPHLRDWASYQRLGKILVGAGTIETARDLWWDIRPSPLLGTVELRICDSVPTLTEACALAALAQAFVAGVCQRLDGGQPVDREPDWLLRENKWRAARHGLAAALVHGDGTVAPLEQEVRELVEQVRPEARRLGCEAQLAGVQDILDHRPSYARQRALVRRGGSLRDVVDMLGRELATDTIGG